MALISQQYRENDTGELACRQYRGLLVSWLKGWVARYPREADDLMQEGWVAFFKALERFDESMGVSFPAYAHECVRGHLKHWNRDKRFAVRIPRHVLAARPNEVFVVSLDAYGFDIPTDGDLVSADTLMVRQCLDRLEPLDRAVLLAPFEGSEKLIARRLGIGILAFRQRAYRARNRLRSALEAVGFQPT